MSTNIFEEPALHWLSGLGLGGYADNMHGGRIVGGRASDPSKLEGLRGGRGKLAETPSGKKAVGVACALNQEQGLPPGVDVGGFLNTRGRKVTELSAAAKQHDTSGERELFPERIGSTKAGGHPGRETTAEYDIFGSMPRRSGAQRSALAQRPTSLSSGETEEAVLQLRLSSGNVHYIKCAVRSLAKNEGAMARARGSCAQG